MFIGALAKVTARFAEQRDRDSYRRWRYNYGIMTSVSLIRDVKGSPFIATDTREKKEARLCLCEFRNR
jgi:hypothetical protein